jgi:hypothetical protein
MSESDANKLFYELGKLDGRIEMLKEANYTETSPWARRINNLETERKNLTDYMEKSGLRA